MTTISPTICFHTKKKRNKQLELLLKSHSACEGLLSKVEGWFEIVVGEYVVNNVYVICIYIYIYIYIYV